MIFLISLIVDIVWVLIHEQIKKSTPQSPKFSPACVKSFPMKFALKVKKCLNGNEGWFLPFGTLFALVLTC